MEKTKWSVNLHHACRLADRVLVGWWLGCWVVPVWLDLDLVRDLDLVLDANWIGMQNWIWIWIWLWILIWF